MRVLLTGAAGFLGSRAAARLVRAGHVVHALVRPSSNLTRLRALAPDALVEPCDMLDDRAVRHVVRKLEPDACVHLAWFAVPGEYLTSSENLAHVRASIALLEALAEASCPRLVTAGTCFEYDTNFGLLSEQTPTAPRSLYAACKHSLFEMGAHASTLSRMSFAHLRFFYQYGPFEHEARLVPSVARALLSGRPAETTSGEQVRDYLHVEDVASAIAFVAGSDLEGAVNIGSGIPVRVRDLVSLLAKACGREDLVRYGALASRAGDPPFVCAEASKLLGAGWCPEFDLERGLADTVRWHMENLRA